MSDKMTPEEAYAEAERLIEEALRDGASDLYLHIPALDIVPPEVGRLQNIKGLYLSDTKVTRLADIAGLTGLQTLDISRTQVTDIAGLKDHPSLNRVDLEHTDKLIDLRPLLDIPNYGKGADGRGAFGYGFHGSGACIDPAIAAAAEIKNPFARVDTLLSHLRSLPPWPDPLPSSPYPPEPQPNSALTLVWDDWRGFELTQTPLKIDPVEDSEIIELQDLLRVVMQDCQDHPDLFDLLNQLRVLVTTNDGVIDARRVHIKYQRIGRMLLRGRDRGGAFDEDAVVAPLSDLDLIVPGITLKAQSVIDLIAQQEANRQAQRPDIDMAPLIKLMELVADTAELFDSPFREIAAEAAVPDIDDRLSGARIPASQTTVVRTGQVVRKSTAFLAAAAAGGIVGNKATELLNFAIDNKDALEAAAKSLGGEVETWLRIILDHAQAAVKDADPGP